MSDFLQIGGSSGLDTANMLVSDSVCGATREPSNFPSLLGLIMLLCFPSGIRDETYF
jgi:hypothetical protein